MTSALLALALLQQVDSAAVAQIADRLLGPRAGLAGAAIVVWQGDRELLLKAYGTDARGRPLDPDSTLFRTASVAKLFIATAAMQLHAARTVDLDRDIAGYIPDLALPARGWPRVTLRQLLSHTAGVEDSFVGTIELAGGNSTSLATFFRRNVPALGVPPGEQVNYSNLGAALGAYVIERAAQVPFDDYVRAHIFTPLGMTQSTYTEPLPAVLRPRVAGDPALMKYRMIPYPAGSLVTTVRDMGRFVAAQLNGGALGTARILDSASTVAMQARVWSAHPAMPGVALGFFESDLAGERFLFHTGSRGHRSALVLVPRRVLGFYVVLDASEGTAPGIMEELTQELLGASWQTAIDSAAARQSPKEYAGRYRLNAGPVRSFEKLGKLAMGDIVVSHGAHGLRMHRKGPIHLASSGRDLFRTTDGMYVAFHRTADGRIDRMHVSGRLIDGVSLDRVSFLESSALHLGLLGGSFVLAVVLSGGRLVRGLWRRVRNRTHVVSSTWPRRVTRGATALYAVAPLPVLVVGLTASDPTVVELTPAVNGVRGMVMVAALFALGGALAIVLGLGGSRPYRVHDGIFAAVAVVTTVLLAYWRVLPLLG
ncbi:MAG TPA: serine hydrolase domain-containing protein [Gemmatimonadaceae bacterium]|nr:serine hydrolase domain-containing protein [Gemmatimonadaceae bacterium]